MNKTILNNVLISFLFLFLACKVRVAPFYFLQQNTNHLVSEGMEADPDQAIPLGISMFTQAKQIDYTEGIAKAHQVLGTAFDYFGRYDSTIKHHMQDLQLRHDFGDVLGISKALISI